MYRSCTVKYNGVRVENALIPEFQYSEKKQQKKIKKIKFKASGHKALKKELWPVFSEYIRLRDDYICCTCGAIGKDSSKYYGTELTRIMQAGHFLPKGSYSGIYFDERNVHCQCAFCNMNMIDPAISDAYYNFMINKYGQQTIEILKSEGKNKMLSSSEMSLLIPYYENEIEKLKKNRP